MRAFTSRAASFLTSRSASALVLYAASWMVQMPRGALAAGVLVLPAGRPRVAGALAGFVVSVRDVETADSGGASTFAGGVGALGDLIVFVAAPPVVRGAGFAVSGRGAAPRDAPAGVTFVVDDGAATGAADGAAVAVAVVVAQWEP